VLGRRRDSVRERHDARVLCAAWLAKGAGTCAHWSTGRSTPWAVWQLHHRCISYVVALGDEERLCSREAEARSSYLAARVLRCNRRNRHPRSAGAPRRKHRKYISPPFPRHGGDACFLVGDVWTSFSAVGCGDHGVEVTFSTEDGDWDVVRCGE